MGGPIVVTPRWLARREQTLGPALARGRIRRGRSGDHRAGPQTRRHRLLRRGGHPRRAHRGRGEHLRPGRPTCEITAESITVHTLRGGRRRRAPLSRCGRGSRHAAARPRSRRPRGLDRTGLSHPRLRRPRQPGCARPIIDTAALARADECPSQGGRDEPDLEWLAGDLGLPAINPHHALGDAITTAEVSSPWPPGWADWATATPATSSISPRRTARSRSDERR